MANQEPERKLPSSAQPTQVTPLEKKAVVSKLFNRKAFIPFWLLSCVAFAVLATPMTWATGLLLLIIGTVVPVVAILLWRTPPPTIAEVLNRVEGSTTRF
jgi:hypothetical protein